MQFAGGVAKDRIEMVATSCRVPFDKLRAGSSARKKRGPQDDKRI
jgi:hypothetical protein